MFFNLELTYFDNSILKTILLDGDVRLIKKYNEPMKTITTYRLSISGHLNSGWEDYFKNCEIKNSFDKHKNPVTVLMIKVSDDSELYGIISKIRGLGMTLVHLNRVRIEERKRC